MDKERKICRITKVESEGATMIATVRQIEYATNLLKQLGYDVEEYNLDGMEVWEISELIDELKDELDG